jgi:hypothetical protein
MKKSNPHIGVKRFYDSSVKSGKVPSQEESLTEGTVEHNTVLTESEHPSMPFSDKKKSKPPR